MLQKIKKSRVNKKNRAKNITNVLVAIADDKYGASVTDFIANYQWPAKTRLLLLYVLEEHSIRSVMRFSPQLAEQIVENDEEYGQDLLARSEKRLKRKLPNTKIESCLIRGSAKDEILENANRIKADIIVLGAHGRTGIGSLLLGSVSMAVATHASCSVVIVRTS